MNDNIYFMKTIYLNVKKMYRYINYCIHSNYTYIITQYTFILLKIKYLRCILYFVPVIITKIIIFLIYVDYRSRSLILFISFIVQLTRTLNKDRDVLTINSTTSSFYYCKTLCFDSSLAVFKNFELNSSIRAEGYLSHCLKVNTFNKQ